MPIKLAADGNSEANPQNGTEASENRGRQEERSFGTTVTFLRLHTVSMALTYI